MRIAFGTDDRTTLTDAIAGALARRGGSIKTHWAHLVNRLAATGLVPDRGAAGWDPGGYTYYLRSHADAFRRGNAFLVGDAAGLATRDLCEGIGPAVRSGLLAADAIALGRSYDLAAVARHSVEHGLVRRALDWAFCGRA